MDIIKIRRKIKEDEYRKIEVDTKECNNCSYLSDTNCILGVTDFDMAEDIECVKDLNTDNPRYFIYKFSLEKVLKKL